MRKRNAFSPSILCSLIYNLQPRGVALVPLPPLIHGQLDCHLKYLLSSGEASASLPLTLGCHVTCFGQGEISRYDTDIGNGLLYLGCPLVLLPLQWEEHPLNSFSPSAWGSAWPHESRSAQLPPDFPVAECLEWLPSSPAENLIPAPPKNTLWGSRIRM